MEYTMRRSALNWLSRGYGGNWTLWETAHMAPMVLVLSSDAAYADGLGKERVLRYILQDDVFITRYDLLTHQSLERAIEVCTTMCPGNWGYKEDEAGLHLNENQVWEKLREACAGNTNLLLNTGPLPDGSLDPEDVAVLRNVGARIRREGLPR